MTQHEIAALNSLACGTCIHQPRNLRPDHPQFQPIREQQGLLRGVHQEGGGQRLLIRKPDVQQEVEITLTCEHTDRSAWSYSPFGPAA